MYFQITNKGKGTIVQSFTERHPVAIGQTLTCDVMLPVSERYEPYVFATVIPDDDDEGWNILKATDSHSLMVNGEPCLVVQKLHDDDHLTFDDGEATIELTFHDGEPPVKSPLRNVFIAMAVIVVCLLGGIGYYFLTKENDYDFRRYEADIYSITVDTVFLTNEETGETSAIDLDSIDGQYQGTAFMTSDGLLITARHCIEPWLGYEGWNGSSKTDDLPSDVRMAIEAETRNILEGTHLKVYSHCIVTNATDSMAFYSSDFSVDRSRDEILCLGDDAHPCYWRSIYSLFNSPQPELGDFAYLQLQNGKHGNIDIANIEDLRTFNGQDKKEGMALGFPVMDSKESRKHNHPISSKGQVQPLSFNAASTGLKEDILIVHIDIYHGNSGGPVLARIGKKIKAIGIISKADTKAGDRTDYAVPVTEVLSLKAKGGKTDETIYRR